ncbi:MAG: outer membrane protein assembly factor BamD [Candidatus Omnitrophota bacterium]|jgi:outer membrane protein assembly factor BamD (BamD/ComL family)
MHPYASIKVKAVLFLFSLLFFNFIFFKAAYPQDSEETYQTGLQAAKSRDSGFAFMYFQMLLDNYPESRHRQDALFATGEYYFFSRDYRDAAGKFLQLVNDYPGYKGEIFALAYLFKLAELQGKESLAKELENKIVTYERLIFLFKDYKKYKFKSPLYRKYEVIYHIDNVEFYLDGEIFAKIYY